MNIRKIWLKNYGNFAKLEADIILKIFFEDVDFGVESILIFTMIE